MEPQRKIIFDTLGARCQLCGFDRYPEALTVEADKKLSEFAYRLKYLEYCLDHLDKCRVICMNCKTHQMSERRGNGVLPPKPKPKGKPVLVWPCPLPRALGVRYPWLDRKLEEGLDVRVYFAKEDEVWSYPAWDLAGKWKEFQAAVGGPEKPPEGIVTIE
jgi:hypothetical protein